MKTKKVHYLSPWRAIYCRRMKGRGSQRVECVTCLSCLRARSKQLGAEMLAVDHRYMQVLVER